MFCCCAECSDAVTLCSVAVLSAVMLYLYGLLLC